MDPGRKKPARVEDSLTPVRREHYNFIELFLHREWRADACKASGTVKLDNKMKRLLREMGEAINDSLSTSDDLSGTIDRIRQEGYDIFLILEATIGSNPRSGEDGEQASRTLPADSPR